MNQVVNHLWQSTLFAGVAAWLAFLLRSNRAQVRYWLWMAASLKFLIPFVLLLTLGRQISWRSAEYPSPTTSLVELAAQPITAPFQLTQPARTTDISWTRVIAAVWGFGVLAVGLYWWKRARPLRRALQSAQPLDLGIGVRIRTSPELLEPGVFGVFRPVLLVPEGFAQHLDSKQWQAILAHELSHIRRRDNLYAAVHMMVEALFWFHPLVWWVGARLIEERERACDEEVIRQGNHAEDYAAGLIEVCKRYVETPLACAAGVTGGELKKRIRAILSKPSKTLDTPRKLLLIACGAAAILIPLVFGALNAPPLKAQPPKSQPSGQRMTFEVATVKEHTANENMRLYEFPPGRAHMVNLPLEGILDVAYNLPFQGPERIQNVPEWVRNTRFDIDGVYPIEALGPNATYAEREAKTRLMLQSLLADRFKLVIHTEKKELPVYAVVLARGGPKLTKANMEEKDCPVIDPANRNQVFCHTPNGGQGRGIHGKALTIRDIARFTANWSDRPIIDKSGISTLYAVDTEGWAPLVRLGGPGDNPNNPESDPTRPSLFSIYDGMGLHLESQRAPVELYFIDSISKPAEN
jgi:uncharacterized protein (TIGR03435 family)